MALNSFEARSLALLGQRIDKQIQDHALNLAKGSALRGDVSGTAQNYAEQIGYMRALENVIDWCKDIEDELLGRKRD